MTISSSKILGFAFALAALTAFSTFSTSSMAQETEGFEIMGEANNADASAAANAVAEEEATSEENIAQPTTEEQAEKFEIAKKLIEINPVEDDLTRAVDSIAERVPANRRILFKSIINRSIKADRLNAAAQLAYAEVFTLEELKAMYAFDSSPAGQSIKAKMPQFKERIDPVIRTMVEDALYNVQNSNVDFSQ